MIAGIDPSTASLGLADVAGVVLTVKPKAKADDHDRRLDELERAVIRHLRLRPPLPAAVLIEGPAEHSKGIRATIAVAEVRGVIRLALWRLDVTVIEVNPTHLKRYATGRGNADKTAMVDSAREDYETTIEAGLDVIGGRPRNDDEADAYWLRHLGRAAYGLEHPTLSHRLEVVASRSWPHLPRRSTP